MNRKWAAEMAVQSPNSQETFEDDPEPPVLKPAAHSGSERNRNRNRNITVSTLSPKENESFFPKLSPTAQKLQQVQIMVKSGQISRLECTKMKDNIINSEFHTERESPLLSNDPNSWMSLHINPATSHSRQNHTEHFDFSPIDSGAAQERALQAFIEKGEVLSF